MLEGLRGEESISELFRREGISPNLYYSWSKAFLEAGKQLKEFGCRSVPEKRGAQKIWLARAAVRISAALQSSR